MRLLNAGAKRVKTGRAHILQLLQPDSMLIVGNIFRDLAHRVAQDCPPASRAQMESAHWVAGSPTRHSITKHPRTNYCRTIFSPPKIRLHSRRMPTPPWKKPTPQSGSKTKLTPASIAWAKATAKQAGRRYPNLIDNMAAARRQLTAELARDNANDHP